MVDKDYKQEFQKVDGEHSTPVDVVTQPHTKRCNVDEVGMGKDQDAIVEDIANSYEMSKPLAVLYFTNKTGINVWNKERKDAQELPF